MPYEGARDVLMHKILRLLVYPCTIRKRRKVERCFRWRREVGWP